MELRIKIKPAICQARTKAECFGGFYGKTLNYSSEGYVSYRGGKFWDQEKVKKAYWTAYVYDFTPYKNIKIKQNTRNFTITQK